MVTSKEFQELMRQAREREFYNSLLSKKSPVTKKECFLDFFKYVSTDERRPYMQGVYHDNGFKIATNGCVLAMCKASYESRFEGVILSKELTPIEGSFPNYKRVLPDFDGMYEIFFDLEKAAKDLRSCKEFFRIEGKLNRADLTPYQMPNGGFVSKKHIEGIIEFLSCYPDAKCYCYDDSMKMYAFVSGDLKDYEAILLVMPCRGDVEKCFCVNNFYFTTTDIRELETLLLRIGKKEILSRLKFGTTTKNDQKVIDACLEFISYSIGKKAA